MKDFLIKTIKGLWAIAGVDQNKELIEKSGGKVDSKGVPVAVGEFIHILEKECDRFKFPLEKKKELIEKGIKAEVAAGYFRGLNGALINKWFYGYKMSSQIAGHETTSHDDYYRITERNRIKYTNQLKEKRKLDPDYDPEQAAVDMRKNIHAKIGATKRRTIKERYYDANGTEDIDYKEIE